MKPMRASRSPMLTLLSRTAAAIFGGYALTSAVVIWFGLLSAAALLMVLAMLGSLPVLLWSAG